jgi:putative membrane protein
MRRCIIAAAAVLAALAVRTGTVLAHDGEPHSPGEIWLYWNLDLFLLVTLLAAGYLYLRGVRRLWKRAGRGRGVARWQPVAFIAGLLLLAAALMSPIDALAAVLFSAHMVQHVLLMMLAAPLIAFSSPLTVWAWSLPVSITRRFHRAWQKASPARRAWRVLTSPLSAWSIYAVVSVGWHHPVLYEAALRYEWVHYLEHAMFFGAALLFWWKAALSGQPGEMSNAQGALYVFTAALFGGGFAAVMSFSTVAWYPFYPDPSAFWGLSRVEDQQVAGMVMWVPGKIMHLLVIITLLSRELQSRGSKQPGKEKNKREYLPLEDISGCRRP